MEVTVTVLLVLAIFVVVPALIGFGILGTLRLVKPSRAAGRESVAALACAVDADLVVLVKKDQFFVQP